VTRQVSSTPSKLHLFEELLPTQAQFWNFLRPSGFTTLNLKAVSSQLEHVPHVNGQALATPDKLHLEILFFTQRQSLVILSPFHFSIFNRSGESVQVDDGGVGAGVVGEGGVGDSPALKVVVHSLGLLEL